MKCISCEIEINPQWKHAVEINVCPFCGKHIMDEYLKNLFVSLRETMEELSKYPDQLDDWMLSNYSFIKTDSPNLKLYLPKETIKDLHKDLSDKEFQVKKEQQKPFKVTIKTEQGEEEITSQKTMSDTQANEFFKRAEAFKPKLEGFNSIEEKNQHLKQLAQRIKKEGSPMLSGASFPDLESEDLETYDDEYSSSDSEYGISSSLSNQDDDEIPSVVLAMAGAKSGDGSTNTKDLLALQKMQDKAKHGRSALRSGKGSFSRS